MTETKAKHNTKQKIVRLSLADREKLAELAAEFGSESQAIRIAIRRLYSAVFVG